MDSTGAHHMEAMPSDGLRRRRHRRTEAKAIHVESLLGHRTFSLELDLSATVAEVKAMIHKQGGPDPMQQVLIFREQPLNDDHRTLADYGVQHGQSSSLFLTTRLHGGEPPEKGGTGSHRMEAMPSEGLRRPSQGGKMVVVKTFSGKIIKLQLDLSETIDQIKYMIYEKTKPNVPPDQQRLIFNGRQAEDGRTLEEYGFQYGTKIHLVLRLRGGAIISLPKIDIFVTKLDGEIFRVGVCSLTSPIYEVRRTIREQEGIRQTQQHLVFCGQPLDDDRTLADYNIQEHSILHLAPGPRGSDSGLLEIEGSGAHRMEAIASEGLRQIQGAKTIIVKNSSGEFTKLELDLSETIAGVKAMIYEKEGTHPALQILTFKRRQATDVYCTFKDKSCTLEEYGFQYGTIIHLVEDFSRDGPGSPPKINIFVTKLDGEIFTVWSCLTSPIYEVRRTIREQEGIRQTQQHLVFCGQPLDDDRTLTDYNIQEHSTLHLAPGPRGSDSGLLEIEGSGAHRMEAIASEGLRQIQEAKTIIVKNSSGEFTKLELDLSETIAGVKAMIYEKEGTHPALQILTFKRRQATDVYCTFKDKSCTLEEYGFQYGTIIHLDEDFSRDGPGSPPKINIFVTKLDGEIFTVWSCLTSPIYEVRSTIREQEGIRQTQQHLVFCGQPLDDDRTLADYNIQEDSILHLAPGSRGGNSGLHEDEDGLVKTGQAAGTYAAPVGEGSSHGQEGQSSSSQSQALMLCHHEGRNEQMDASSEIMEASSEIMEEPPSMVVNDTVPVVDEFNKQQQEQIRWSKYSVKALVFAITTLVTYLGSASTLFSTGSMVFKISVGAFFITDAMLSIMMPPKIGSALVYLSCLLLVLVSYLLLVSFNKYYGYAILPVLLPIVTALLQYKLLPGLMQHQSDHTVDIEVPGQDHGTDEEDGQDFDRIFELSAEIVNCGGFITVVFGNYMVGPVSAVGFLFFYTVALGLYLMMVTTVRAAVLIPHARYLAKLLKVLLVITLITALIRGVHRYNVSGA